MELSLAMLVKVRRRVQLWAVRWESFAGAMRGDDRHRADTSTEFSGTSRFGFDSAVCTVATL